MNNTEFDLEKICEARDKEIERGHYFDTADLYEAPYEDETVGVNISATGSYATYDRGARVLEFANDDYNLRLRAEVHPAQVNAIIFTLDQGVRYKMQNGLGPHIERPAATTYASDLDDGPLF